MLSLSIGQNNVIIYCPQKNAFYDQIKKKKFPFQPQSSLLKLILLYYILLFISVTGLPVMQL